MAEDSRADGPVQLIETMRWQAESGYWLLDRHLARLELGKVECRIDQEEVPQLSFVGFASRDQRNPGEKGRLGSSHALQRIRERPDGSPK